MLKAVYRCGCPVDSADQGTEQPYFAPERGLTHLISVDYVESLIPVRSQPAASPTAANCHLLETDSLRVLYRFPSLP